MIRYFTHKPLIAENSDTISKMKQLKWVFNGTACLREGFFSVTNLLFSLEGIFWTLLLPLLCYFDALCKKGHIWST